MKPHDKILTEAARRHLKPLGGIQKGRSRIWLVDCAWYVAVIEFQPSSWSKGAYLNVGAHFLWRPVDHITFDFGHRKEGYEEFLNEEQFSVAAERLAQRAAEEVGLLRAKLPNPRVIHSMTPRNTGEGWIDRFHRGVSHALDGQPDSAVLVLQSLFHPSQQVTPADAEEYRRLLSIVADAPAFERRIVELIKFRRNALHLSALENPL